MLNLAMGADLPILHGVKFVWLALSSDSVPVCCESPPAPDAAASSTMPIEQFERITEIIAQGGAACRVLLNRNALPDSHAELCRARHAELFAPNEYEGPAIGTPLTLTVDQTNPKLNARLSPSRVVLRVRRAFLENLANDARTLLSQVSRVSLRHPELLQYTDHDFALYRVQLERVAGALLEHGSNWSAFHVDCLTDGIVSSSTGECNAGLEHLTIGHDGQTYLCPAFRHTGEGLGLFLDEARIPDRHLLTRAYSLVCRTCSSAHCLRCVYHNRMATREHAVPGSRSCRLAQIEQGVSAALAVAARAQGWWKPDWTQPELPLNQDPCELTDECAAPSPLWRNPGLAAGRAGEMTPAAMLEVIHELHGFLRAVRQCLEAGVTPSSGFLLADTPLSRARRWTIEAYRDIPLGPELPGLREFERTVLRTIEERSHATR